MKKENHNFERFFSQENGSAQWADLEELKSVATLTRINLEDDACCGSGMKEIRTEKVTSDKYAIIFPIYKVDGDMYHIYLVSEGDKFYLSDEGTTYAELDKIFEMSEPDVIKNLVNINRQYGVRKHQWSNAFTIECTPQDVQIKLGYLIQCLSFMLNMKIFYT